MNYRHVNIINLVNIALAIVLFDIVKGIFRLEIAVALVLTSLVMINIKDGHRSLLVAILAVLVIGVIVVVGMILNPSYLVYQVKGLWIFIVYAFLQFSLWYSIHNITKYGVELISLRKKIYKREGLGENKMILSLEEFKVRKELINNISKRNGEKLKTLYVHITVPSNASYYRAVLETVGYSLSSILRKNYDLISKVNESTYVILLQNVNKKGVQRVRERFLLNLCSYMRDAEDYVQIVEMYEEGGQ
ncbi:MAG: hypothetical protein ACRC2K_02475 [Clostridium sp.]